ncbi:hypothetical protein Y032_0067g123 [Ancylostoma ceylanicum]|uniref:Uncharacterized protein n=1 Tax=Ancylostoma ceylanicum TaxID=53326 RepID=A0A016TYJ7_9BILA|nr:hypothetical protein Y032_0067g123 [Ancylostoma ceylanicum]
MAPPLKIGKKSAPDGCYSPAKFAMDASSPYFIGKHKFARRCIEKGENPPAKKGTLAGYGFGGDGFCSGTQPESSRGELVRKESPQVNRASSVASGPSINSCNGVAFDFSGDPKVKRVREVIVSIVDSERKRDDDKELHDAIAATACRAMEFVSSNAKPKRTKGYSIILST